MSDSPAPADSAANTTAAVDERDPARAIQVDIWSDVQCPWCYIGKRRFEAALESTGIPVQIQYHSYELSPDAPVEYEGTHEQYLSERKGIPAEQARQMIGRVVDVAEGEGLHYDYDRVRHTNTAKAHELLHYAKERGKQAELKERLLAAYFVEGRHVGDLNQLADLAAEVGLDRAEALAALENEQYRAAVKADVMMASAYGIQGVPFYVFENKYGVSGAQSPETFAGVLEQVRAELDAPVDATDGASESATANAGGES